MKQYFPLLFLLLFCCNGSLEKKEIEPNELSSSTLPLIPIAYDFDHLALHLNTSINDTTSGLTWRWDYMTSENSLPDSTGIDYYMNLSQPSFRFDGETTLPSLSVKTYKNKIKAFSVTTLVTLPDQKEESINRMFDSLKRYDLLNEPSVRESLLAEGEYISENQETTSSVKLIFSEEENGWSRVQYEIKIRD